jgi:hypothetical protein
VQPIIEALGVAVDAGDASAAPSSRQPLSFAAHDGDIVGLWLPPHPAAALVPGAIVGDAWPGPGEIRRRTGCRVALAHPGSLDQAFRASADLVLLDATGREVGLDGWVRLATERERGASVIVVTHSAMDAYRCDRSVLAMWSLSELLSALDSLVGDMQEATRDLVAGTSPPRRAAVLAVELQRGNRALRDLIDLARRMARSQEDRLQLSELTGRAAGVTIDERVLEKLIAQAEGL